ncbi:MAG: carboxypeptidase-like regulatory domain-containing protein [Mobilitalea sp.]
MFIKDSYLLTTSHTFELKDMQEVTVNIELVKVPRCYHTHLTGRVLHKNKPIKRAGVKVFDCKYNPLYHTVTNSRGVYRFKNILAPGIYKVVAASDGYQTSRTRNIKIKANKVIRISFQLKKCSIFTNSIKW